MPGISILQVVCVYIQVTFVYSACTNGWFGLNCQYKCHCTNDNCDVNGICVGDSRCVRGWFGQSCQYQDLTGRDTTITPPDNAITDGDDTTCTLVEKTSITWRFAYRIKWLRIVLINHGPIKLLDITFMDSSNKITTCPDKAMLRVSETITDILCNLNVTVVQVYLDFKEIVSLCSVYIDGGPLKHLDITFTDSANKIITCPNKAMQSVNETVTDILCNLDVTVLQVYLDFKEIVSLCSVYIDGGRNVALKQPTVQSTDLTFGGILYDSSKAVDGNPSADFHGVNSCTHTQDTPPSSWTVVFNQSCDVNRYVIYNRDIFRTRLKGFNLVSYNAQNITLFNYTDTNPREDVLIYNVTTTSTKAVSSITIIAKDTGNVLTLCEVEVYGYDSCPKGTYNIGCSNTCNCRDKSESCFVATGQCWSGCASGFQGEGCSQKCDETYYGEDCAQRCSTNCTGQLCNNVDGTCRSCPVGRDGPYCEQACKEHMYGANCNMTCPLNCLNNLCNAVTGQCLVCVAGYTGAMCDLECAATYFGQNCSRRCSSTCLDRLCNNTDGLCVSCVAGRTGDFCEQGLECKINNESCSSNQQLGPLTCSGRDRLADGVGIGVGAMCGLLIIIVSVGCIVKKFRATLGNKSGAYNTSNHQVVMTLDLSPQTSHNTAK